jgi:branched-chain amino acid transport system substrate-binding protein
MVKRAREETSMSGDIRRRAGVAALAFGAAAVAAGAPVGTAEAQDKVLRIGQLGVMSGPAASWGLVNRYTAEVQAQIINENGGWEIDGEKYRIEIVPIDDRNDARVAISGLERLAYQDGIHYVIGPNVDETTRAILPVVSEAGVINVSYGWEPGLFSPPNENTVLGMIAAYQSAPVIYEYLRDEHGVESVTFVPRNDESGLNSARYGVEAAEELGLKVLSDDVTYEPGTTDFFPIMGRVVPENPDLIVLSGVAPSDAPLLIRAAREMGYQGLISTETAHDVQILEEIAGEMANGFISVGGASAEEIRTPEMDQFIQRYIDHVGEWNDEAGTKVYALHMILETLSHAGAEAIDDVEVFKAAMADVRAENPYIRDEFEHALEYVGSGYFDQLRQISVPLVVHEYRDGRFETLFIGAVER